MRTYSWRSWNITSRRRLVVVVASPWGGYSRGREGQHVDLHLGSDNEC